MKKKRVRRKRPVPSVLLIKKFSESGGIEFPKLAGDCGYDLVVAEDAVLMPRALRPTDIPCGFAMKIPDTHFALVINRSSASGKLGIGVIPSIIDSGYTGPMFTCAYNMTDVPIAIAKGMRLAQIVLLPKFTPELVFVDDLPETERGDAGLGSTGA